MSTRALGGQFDPNRQFHTEKSGQMSIWGGKGGVRDYMTDADRYPRGYTPQRQQEVSQALDDEHRLFASPQHNEIHPEEAKAAVRDNIARSTIPISDLEGLRSIDANAPAPDGDIQGSYFDRIHKIKMYPDVRGTEGNRSVRGDEMNETLIHEIGHHTTRDAITPRWNRVPLRDRRHGTGMAPAIDGIAEGMADNYAHANARYRHPKRAGTADERLVNGAYAQYAMEDPNTRWSLGYLKASGARQAQANTAPPSPTSRIPWNKGYQFRLF